MMGLEKNGFGEERFGRRIGLERRSLEKDGLGEQ